MPMLQKLLQQFKIFSHENWWIYVLLMLAVSVVLYTGKWNIYEVIAIFFLNLSGAMCNMLMMSSYKDKRFVEGSIFIVMANVLYTFLSLYAWLHDGDLQYIFWQTSFLLTGFKALFYYMYNINIRVINFVSILILNSIVMFALIFHVWIWFWPIVQSFGIACITLWLSLTHDMKRYFFILIWNTLVVLGTSSILVLDYMQGSILGVTVAYALLWLSICSYNYKILPVYISRYKNI